MAHVVSIALCLIFFFVSMSESGKPEKCNKIDSSGSDEMQNQGKRKGSRTEFTEDQLSLLSGPHQGKPGMTKEDRDVLPDSGDLDCQAVKNWCNNNRAKIKNEGDIAYGDQEKILKPVMHFLQIAKTSVVSSKKRGRPGKFSCKQLSILESSFKKHKYLSSESRSQLACDAGLSHKQVNVWFQNNRYKGKKGKKGKKEKVGQWEDGSKKDLTKFLQYEFPSWDFSCIDGNIDSNPPGCLIYCTPKCADGSGPLNG